MLPLSLLITRFESDSSSSSQRSSLPEIPDSCEKRWRRSLRFASFKEAVAGKRKDHRGTPPHIRIGEDPLPDVGWYRLFTPSSRPPHSEPCAKKAILHCRLHAQKEKLIAELTYALNVR